jgi:predicted adenine nucleotide alpha hydrolase (AANH) superfamily ATPase
LGTSDERSDGIPLLLHACCGPCSLEPLRLLREEGFEPTICWTNPNIAPMAEHDLRLSTLMAWAHEVAQVDVIVAGDDRAAWERSVAPAGFDRARRCRACYALRLAELCRVAKERGFRAISTTLAVSPYQLFDECHDVLLSLATHHGLTPVWRDFRGQYPEATKRSRELGMYRQNYCGCRFSAAEAAVERQQARDERKAAKRAERERAEAAAHRERADTGIIIETSTK